METSKEHKSNSKQIGSVNHYQNGRKVTKEDPILEWDQYKIVCQPKPPKRPIKEEFINTMHCSSMETWNTGDVNKKSLEWEQYNMVCQQIAPVFNNLSNYPMFVPGQPSSAVSPRIKAPYTYGDYKRLRSEGTFTGNNEIVSPNSFEVNQVPKYEMWNSQHICYQLEVQRVQLQKQGEAIRILQMQNEILMRKFDKDYIPNSFADIQLKAPSPVSTVKEARHDDPMKSDDFKNDQRFKSNDYDRNTWKSERGRDRDGNRNRYYGSNRGGRNYNNNYSYNRRDRDNNFSRNFNASPQAQNTSASSNTGEEDWDAELANSSKSVPPANMISKNVQEASGSVEESWDDIDVTKSVPTSRKPVFSNKITVTTNDEEESWDDIDITIPVDSGTSKNDTETKNETDTNTLVDPKSDTKNDDEENWETTDSVIIKVEEIPSTENPQNTDNCNEGELSIQPSDWKQMKKMSPLTEEQFDALLNETKEIELTAQDMKQDEENPDATEKVEL